MNKSWFKKKLGEICGFIHGFSFKADDFNEKGLGIPVIRTGDLNNLRNTEKFYKGPYQESYVVEPGDILIGLSGTIISGIWHGSRALLNQRVVKLINFRDADKKFVGYILPLSLKKLSEELSRSAVKNVLKHHLENLEIYIPPLPIQQKIVKILDTIQEAIEIQEKIIEKAKELKKSLANLLFHYGLAGLRVEELASSRVGELTSSEIEKLGLRLKKTEVGEIPEDWDIVTIKDAVLKTKQNDPSKSPLKQIKYIDVSSISNESLKIIEYKSYLGKDAPSRARKILKENDIIFATVRPYLKRIAFVTREYDGFYASTAFCILRPKFNELSPYFLFYYLSNDNFVFKVSGYQTGSGYPAITDDHIKNELMPLPSLPEQQEIAEILQTIDQKIEIEKRKKELYEELFKTMLNKIMSQEVDVEKIDF